MTKGKEKIKFVSDRERKIKSLEIEKRQEEER